jgi:hypothetical protein
LKIAILNTFFIFGTFSLVQWRFPERELFALKPVAERYERAITKARGLSVLVYPNGTKTFAVRYTAPNGARRRLVLGDYPGLSLADARLKAGGARIEIAEARIRRPSGRPRGARRGWARRSSNWRRAIGKPRRSDSMAASSAPCARPPSRGRSCCGPSM